MGRQFKNTFLLSQFASVSKAVALCVVSCFLIKKRWEDKRVVVSFFRNWNSTNWKLRFRARTSQSQIRSTFPEQLFFFSFICMKNSNIFMNNLCDSKLISDKTCTASNKFQLHAYWPMCSLHIWSSSYFVGESIKEC